MGSFWVRPEAYEGSRRRHGIRLSLYKEIDVNDPLRSLLQPEILGQGIMIELMKSGSTHLS